MKYIPRNIFNSIYVCALVLILSLSLLSGFSYSQNNSDQDILDATIESVLENINVDSVTSIIRHLQNYNTRFMIKQNRFDISQWIFDSFSDMGFTDVAFDSFYASTFVAMDGINIDTLTLQRNVIATIKGSIDPDQEIIVCGHYDSFNNTDPFKYAPGADDNASGTAAVMEIARAMKLNGFMPEKTIRFIAFAAEELLYFGDGGSEHYAQTAYSNNDNIILVVNHDMISHTLQSYENSLVDINRHPDSDIFSLLALSCLRKYTALDGRIVGFWSSDLGSFIDQGYRGIYFEETDFSPYYHSPDDIQDNYDMAYCTDVIKASAATIINMAQIPNQIHNLLITENKNNNSILVKWSAATESDISKYKLHITDKHGAFDEQYFTSDTTYIMSGLSQNTMYNIKLSALDYDGNEGLVNSASYISISFTHNDGILIVDQTKDGDGSLLNPTDEHVDAFFREICTKFKTSEIDIAQNGIGIEDIVTYSTIIWHGNENFQVLQNFLPELAKFLDAGGNFIYAGEKPTLAFATNQSYPNTFSEGQFIFDYLKINKTVNTFGSRFNGALSNAAGYPDIYTDSLKTKSSVNFHLKNIEAIFPSAEAESLYLYSSEYDSGSFQGAMKGDPVAITYDGEYKTVIFSFPLYYMDSQEAQFIVEKILTERFDEITHLQTNTFDQPSSPILEQNYPNPFNHETIINYQLPARSEVGQITTDVKLLVYDALGRLVKILVDEKQNAGMYQVHFDASGLASGIYYYKLKSGSIEETKKMLLMK